MNKDVAQLIDRINATPGYVVSDEQTGGGHWQAFRADADGRPVGKGVTLPSTPSDPNHLNVSRGKLRRLLDWIDPITRSGQKQQQQAKRANRPTRTARKDKDMATIREIVRVTGDAKTPSLQSGVRDVARFVWGQLKNEAAGQSGSAMQHMGVPGYRWTGRLVNVMCGFWPELSELDAKERNYTVQRVRDVLTQQSKRMVVLRQGNPSKPTIWFIRAAWDVDGIPVRPVEPKVTKALEPASPPHDDTNEVMPKASLPQTVANRGAARDDPISPATSPNIGVEDMLAFLARYDALSQEHDALIEPFRRLAETAKEMQAAMDEIGSILQRGGVTR